MVLPLIPVVVIAVSAASGGTGLFAGTRGALKLKRARATAAVGQATHDEAVAQTNEVVEAVNLCLGDYGRKQEEAHLAVVNRMVRFLERNQRLVSQRAQLFADGATGETHELARVTRFTDPIGWVKGGASAAAASAATFAGVPALVTSVGTASTGAAISGLSGAAAESATLAWLGGGALSTGGLGVAGGTLVLNAATAGPALLIGGLALNGQGEKALTRAERYNAEVQLSCANQDTFRSTLGLLRARVEELEVILARLVARAVKALEVLESVPLDSDEGTVAFQHAMALVVSVRDVIAAPVVDEHGALTNETKSLIIRYRESE